MMVRWSPLSEFDTLQRNINRLFNDVSSSKSERQEGPDAMWAPPVNTYEDKEGYTLYCDLPGMNQKDVKVNLDKDTLTISGTRKLENEENRESYQRIECAFGTFNRSFSLPGTIDSEKIDANMENGVLKVRLPKREESKPKQISISIKGK
jgi:HSP20 family protein